MGGAGTYSLSVVGEDGTFVEFGSSELVLECNPCAGAVFDYFSLEMDCTPISETLCCALPSVEEAPVGINWTVSYYDTCNNLMGSDSGTIYHWQEECLSQIAGDTSFTTPDMVTYDVSCDCINP